MTLVKYRPEKYGKTTGSIPLNDYILEYKKYWENN